jgi:hypothetical protein
MNFNRLSAKQKRALQWTTSAANGDVREDLRVTFVTTLQQYKEQLAKCWEADSINDEQAQQIVDLERQLEELESESRLRAS